MRMFAYDIYEPIGRKDEDTFPVILLFMVLVGTS